MDSNLNNSSAIVQSVKRESKDKKGCSSRESLDREQGLRLLELPECLQLYRLRERDG